MAKEKTQRHHVAVFESQPEQEEKHGGTQQPDKQF
jgi:hypothetical protein